MIPPRPKTALLNAAKHLIACKTILPMASITLLMGEEIAEYKLVFLLLQQLWMRNCCNIFKTFYGKLIKIFRALQKEICFVDFIHADDDVTLDVGAIFCLKLEPQGLLHFELQFQSRSRLFDVAVRTTSC